MRFIGFVWGVAGVIAFLMLAVFRLTPNVLELELFAMDWWHWLSLVLFVPYMIYAEGYKGFHRNFSPRVVLRAHHLLSKPKPVLVIFAPVYAMGYFHATDKRKRVSFILTAALLVLILIVRNFTQPWRGIIDAGVVFGLSVGVMSLFYYWVKILMGKSIDFISPDLPE